MSSASKSFFCINSPPINTVTIQNRAGINIEVTKFKEYRLLANSTSNNVLRCHPKTVCATGFNNKKTYMLINALRLSEGKDHAELTKWISSTDYEPAEKIAAVTALYNRLGIDRLCLEKIESYYSLCLQQLNSLTVDAARTVQLRELAARLMERNV